MFKLLSHCKCIINSRNILKRTLLERICWNAINKMSTNRKNHYETLNLSRNCSTKEIRDAFIKLSKQYHPDKNKGNPKAQEEFVRISEAYNVLIKPASRQEYDFSLKSFSDPSHIYKSGRKDDYYEVHRYDSHYRDPWKDPSFYRNRSFHEEDKETNYYGVRGIKKQPNETFLFWILVFACFGIILQFSVIRYASASTKLARDRKSEENRRHLEYVKERAEFYGTRERQMEELMRRAGIFDDVEPESNPKVEDKPD